MEMNVQNKREAHNVIKCFTLHASRLNVYMLQHNLACLHATSATAHLNHQHTPLGS